jgi:hypothetical protein
MGLDWWTGCVSLASCLQRPPTTSPQLAHNISPLPRHYATVVLASACSELPCLSKRYSSLRNRLSCCSSTRRSVFSIVFLNVSVLAFELEGFQIRGTTTIGFFFQKKSGGQSHRRATATVTVTVVSVASEVTVAFF